MRSWQAQPRLQVAGRLQSRSNWLLVKVPTQDLLCYIQLRAQVSY
jgi:hypothetical protein